jgi:hypothetical protein
MSLRSFALVSVAFLLSTLSALAESRMALVIGNSAYQSVTALPNPANDAQAVAELLNNAGFDVVLARDLTHADMQQTIRDFVASISAKGPDNVALVFYAGHGLQVEGENFLVPVDARIQQESDVRTATLSLVDLMKELQSVPSQARIVILDACRNNPFTAVQKATGRGLAIVDAPTGSMVAYSTAPGTEASDGAGKNSPYTAALVQTIQEPGLHIEQMFKHVRLRVHKSTDGRQTPWESSSLTVNFAFFAAVAAAPAKPGEAASPTPEPARPEAVAAEKTARIAKIRTLPPSEAYDVVIEEDSIEAYQQFVQLYPTDPLCDRIRRILFRRQQMVAWQNATLANTRDAYEAYLSRFPYGDHAATATRLRVDPRPAIDPVVAPRNFPFPRFPSQDGSPSRPGGPFKPPGQGSPVVTLPPSQNNPPPAKPGAPGTVTPPGPTGNTGPIKTPVTPGNVVRLPPKVTTGTPPVTAPITTPGNVVRLPPKVTTGTPPVTAPITTPGNVVRLPPKVTTGTPPVTAPITTPGNVVRLPPKTTTGTPPVIRVPTDPGRFRPPATSPLINTSPAKSPVFTPAPTVNRLPSSATRLPSANNFSPVPRTSQRIGTGTGQGGFSIRQ